MTQSLTGKFSGTGLTGTLLISDPVDISLKFGEGTVKLQRLIPTDDGSVEWRTVKTWDDSDVPTGSESVEDAIYPGRAGRAYRLSCTEYVSEIEYFIG